MRYLFIIMSFAFASCVKTSAIVPVVASFKADDSLYIFMANQTKVYRDKNRIICVDLNNGKQHLTFKSGVITPLVDDYWCVAEYNGSTYTFYNSMNTYSLGGFVEYWDGTSIAISFEGYFKTAKGVQVNITQGYINKTTLNP